MKRKTLAFIVFLMMVIPTMALAYEEPAKGTKGNPFYTSKAEEGIIEFKGPNADYSAYATANITVSVVGVLEVSPAYEKISELALIDARGPFYFCYKVLIKAEDIIGGNAIIVTSEAFKVYDTDRVEVPILTKYEQAELLNGTGAYMYIGFRTPKTFPLYIVFNNELWFDLINISSVEE